MRERREGREEEGNLPEDERLMKEEEKEAAGRGLNRKSCRGCGAQEDGVWLKALTDFLERNRTVEAAGGSG